MSQRRLNRAHSVAGEAARTVEAARRVHGVEAQPGTPAMALVLWTGDVDETFEAVVRSGADAVKAAHDSGNGNRNALIRDPDGNLVELVCKVS
jgi:lactoylglutathione lyase